METTPAHEQRVPTVTVYGDWSVVALSGDLDVVSGGILGDTLTELAADGDVALDCSGLELVDSTGLRSIVRANNAARAAGTRFAVVSVPSLLSRLLTITKLTSVVTVYGSAADLPAVGS